MITLDLARGISRPLWNTNFRCYKLIASPFLSWKPYLSKKDPSRSHARLLTSGIQQAVVAAPELDLTSFAPPPINNGQIDVKRLRVVPASPSYFSGCPRFTDDFLMLVALLAKWQRLPVSRPGEAPRAVWKSVDGYMAMVGEPVKPSRYSRLVGILRRLNTILPHIMPEEVSATLNRFKRDIDPSLNRPRPILVDEHGRARAVGRRKESSAVVWLVEGEGQVLINGKKLDHAFPRHHDRDSVVWPLKATNRLDKYNIFGIVRGGGVTGQAEALTLGIARALMAHEPGIKTYLRKAGVVQRDPRMVERKKPGKRKARKMPAWVKR